MVIHRNIQIKYNQLCIEFLDNNKNLKQKTGCSFKNSKQNTVPFELKHSTDNGPKTKLGGDTLVIASIMKPLNILSG